MAQTDASTTLATGPGSAADQVAINTIRCLSMDAVQKANSGHPGTPVSLAPVTYTLWQRFLRFDPANPIWPNRDRFVLSVGHASMLIYSMLHLAKVKGVNPEGETVSDWAVSLDEIKNFRQLHSKTPGHPEYRFTAGVETTTGPLGQGVANSVGMAIAAKWQATYFNKPGFELFDYDVYALAGDGCMMEGVASEAASLAAHLKLDNLCWIYDSNRITIEGHTELAFTEDVGARFEAYGWNVIRVRDANDVAELSKAFAAFKATTGRPTFILVESRIAWGVPGKEDHHSAHGEPLGAEAIKGAKKNYGFDPDKQFEVPEGVYETYQAGVGARGKAASMAWDALFAQYKTQFPELAANLELMQKRELPAGWDKDITPFPWGEVEDPKTGKKKLAGAASRDSGGKVLNAIAKNVPWLMGGSADLAPSTKTLLAGEKDFQAGSYHGRNFHFGVREHAMGAILNGMAVSKVRPYGSGFLIFSDYGRPSIRLAAIMEVPAIYVFTHDSIGVGEDGPTHQPIEQLASLRAIPGLCLMRPGDSNEVIEAWKYVMQLKHEPACIILTRQELTTIDRSKYAPASGVHKGAYILADAPNGKPKVILIGTGSEVNLCLSAYEQLSAEGVAVRVVSMPSWDVFAHQSQEYRDQVLPPDVTARVAVEMGATFGWSQWVGSHGKIIGMKSFGASAPLKDLQKHFGFTVEHVIAAAKSFVS